jgi:hypothetical protein
MGLEDAELRAYYAQGKERDRLGNPKGAVEFERTKEILQRQLPAAPAVIAERRYRPLSKGPKNDHERKNP